MGYALFRMLHLLALLILATTLLISNAGISRRLEDSDIRQLRRMDLIYYTALATVVFCGLALWLWVGRPAAFYIGNPVFHVKMGLTLLLGVLALVHTLYLRRLHTGRTDNRQPPRPVVLSLRLQLILLLCIAVSAYLMARGIGY